MDPSFHKFVDDPYGGHVIRGDTVEPADPESYYKRIRRTANQYLEEDVWRALYVTGRTHPTEIRKDAYHYARTQEAIYHEMARLVQNKPEMDVIELQAILARPDPVPVPVAAPAQVVPPAPAPPVPPPLVLAPPAPVPVALVPEPAEPEPIGDDEDPIEDIEPGDEDVDGGGEAEPVDDDGELEDDPEEDLEDPEPAGMDVLAGGDIVLEVNDDAEDEGLEEVVIPELLAGPIFQMATIVSRAADLVAGIAVQPEGFIIGEIELAEAIAIAEGFTAVAVNAAEPVVDAMDEDNKEDDEEDYEEMMVEEWDFSFVDEAPLYGSDVDDY